MLGSPDYRTWARDLADDAVRVLWRSHADGRGVFAGHPGEDRYDAVDGVGYLLLAFLSLEIGTRPEFMGFGL